MALKLLLTVDLNAVKETERNAFYDFLDEKKLKKTNLTTTWTASFSLNTTYDDAVKAIKNILENAAKAANIKHYEAQFMISSNDVMSVRK
ncbi:hypothetical protein ACX1N5_00835 [Acinetobacter sp. ANC 4636]